MTRTSWRWHSLPSDPAGIGGHQREPALARRMLRLPGMTRTTLWVGLGVAALSASLLACASMTSADAAFGSPGEGSSSSSGGSVGSEPAPTGGSRDLTPTDNAVILVHAAKSQPYRLCFKNELSRLPVPDSQAMPQANVVGVEVGSAVRIAPLGGVPGEVFLFEEPLIRALYFNLAGGAKGPTCDQLLSGATGGLAIPVGKVDANLSSGVHLLTLRGCPKNSAVRTYSTAECGADWTAAAGNLKIEELTLTGANRQDPSSLPAQVVNLSQPIDTLRAGRRLEVTFGKLDGSGSETLVASDPALYAGANPPTPAQLKYAPEDLGSYDTMGLKVRFAAGDAGSGADLFTQSLARIQKLSSPRDVPSDYYAAASNYVFLLLGDPDAKLADGGPDDDERRNAHFLAVPVIAPKPDGADAGDAGTDAP